MAGREQSPESSAQSRYGCAPGKIWKQPNVLQSRHPWKVPLRVPLTGHIPEAADHLEALEAFCEGAISLSHLGRAADETRGAPGACRSALPLKSIHSVSSPPSPVVRSMCCQLWGLSFFSSPKGHRTMCSPTLTCSRVWRTLQQGPYPCASTCVPPCKLS
jgi:hypothetical protein